MLGKAIARVNPFPGFPSHAQKRLSHFRYLARSIVFQQLAGKAASTIHGRACRLSPGPLFPSPKECLAIPSARMRGAGLSRAKLAAVRDLAQRAESGALRLQGLGRLSDDAILERLIKVCGIGPWTAQMFLMFKLGRLDVLPVGDLGVQEGLRILDGREVRPGPAEVEERGAIWAPLRSVATWVMWQLVDEAPTT